MKRITFLLMCIIVNVAYLNAQVFSRSSAGSGTHDVVFGSSDTFLNHYTQKLQSLNDTTHIVFTRNNGQGIFCLVNNHGEENGIVRWLEISPYFKISDFAVLDSTLYFSGYVNIDTSKVAFIAYTDIEPLFAENVFFLDTNNIKYTLFDGIYQDKIYEVNRIEPFYDSVNDVIKLACIGKMYYGTPPKWVFSPLAEELVLRDPAEYQLDFFMLYSVTEESVITNSYDVSLSDVEPIYSPANKAEMFYFAQDTLNGINKRNQFMDIVLTDDFICVVAADFSDTNSSIAPHTHLINVARFNKTDMGQNVCRITLPFEIHPEYGIKVTNLEGNEIALCCIKCQHRIDTTACCVLKIDINDKQFRVLQNSLFDIKYGKAFIRDCLHLRKSNELVVLKYSIFDTIETDIVFHLSMKNNITFPYTSNKYLVDNPINSMGIVWNNISSSNIYNYTLTGCQSRYLMFFDKMLLPAEIQNDCYVDSSFIVHKITPIKVSPISSLQQCAFPILSPNVIDGYLFIWYGSRNWYNAIIKYSSRARNVYRETNRTTCRSYIYQYKQ